MPGLRNIAVYTIETEAGARREVPLAENPAALLTALLEHPDGLPEEAAHRVCDDLATATQHLQRAGIRLEWRQDEGRSVITLAPGQRITQTPDNNETR